MAKKINAFEVMETAALNKEIQEIGKAGHKLNTRIQLAALNAIWYSIEHGDIGFGNRLVLAMNKGQRKTSLIRFLEIHGKFQWDNTTKALVFKKRDDVTSDGVAEIDSVWFVAIKEQEPQSMYDFDEMAVKFIKRMEKAIKDKAEINNSSLYDYIAQAVSQYHQDQLDKEETSNVEEEIEEEVYTVEMTEEAFNEVIARQPLRAAA